MLQRPDSLRIAPTCKVHCKKCCRHEHHYLNIRGKFNRLFYRIVSLGTIGLYGHYRCICCGTGRLGRFDIIRGKDIALPSIGSWLNPLNWWFKRRDSWAGAKRRKRRQSMFGKRKRRKEKPFRPKTW